MKTTKNRLEQEKRTVTTMIKMYCKKNHNPIDTFCDSCTNLLNYAILRLDSCQFGNNKPVCENCSVHCYKVDMREKIRNVMRFSGPRMIYTHPIMGFRHLFRKFQ